MQVHDYKSQCKPLFMFKIPPSIEEEHDYLGIHLHNKLFLTPQINHVLPLLINNNNNIIIV